MAVDEDSALPTSAPRQNRLLRNHDRGRLLPETTGAGCCQTTRGEAAATRTPGAGCCRGRTCTGRTRGRDRGRTSGKRSREVTAPLVTIIYHEPLLTGTDRSFSVVKQKPFFFCFRKSRTPQTASQ